MDINRVEVLDRLEKSMVAVTSSAILEQSDTFVFQGKELLTFNGEVCTRQNSPFGDIEGSIMASDFLKVLQRFPDERLVVEQRAGELVIKGQRRSAGIKMMAEVLLPFSDIPKPTKFIKFPSGLRETLLQAAQVCGKDETAPKTTHVHIAPDRVESTDSFRVFRADFETGLTKPVLVHASNLITACKHPIEKMAVSKEDWFHFVTHNGMILSLLCSADEYYKKKMIDKILEVHGEEVTLPSNLADILSRAEIMDTPNLSIGGWDSRIAISLSNGMLRITSRKEDGWFKETRKIKYEGPDMSFSIHPTFLKELMSRTRKVTIGEHQIKVEVDNIHFTAALESSEEK